MTYMYQPENERSPFFPLQDIHCIPDTTKQSSALLFSSQGPSTLKGFPPFASLITENTPVYVHWNTQLEKPHSSVMNAMADRIDASVQYVRGGRQKCNTTRKRRSYRTNTIHVYNDSSVPVFTEAHGIPKSSNNSTTFPYVWFSWNPPALQSTTPSERASIHERQISSRQILETGQMRSFSYDEYRSIVVYIYNHKDDTQLIAKNEFTVSEDWYLRDTSVLCSPLTLSDEVPSSESGSNWCIIAFW